MTKQEKLSKINNNLQVAIAEEKAKKAAAESEYYANVHRLQKGAQEMREAVYNEPDEPQDNDQPTVWLDGAQEMREAVYNEPAEPQDNDKPTVWLDGAQWTAAVVARRILNKLPKLNYPKESIYIELSPSCFGGCGLGLRYINTIDKGRGVTSCELLAKDEPEEQAAKVDLWLKDVEVHMARAQEIMREEADNE